jgi:hypothetical protein
MPAAKQPVPAAEKSATKLGNSVLDKGVTKDITQVGKRKLPSTATPPGGSRLVAPPMPPVLGFAALRLVQRSLKGTNLTISAERK